MNKKINRKLFKANNNNSNNKYSKMKSFNKLPANLTTVKTKLIVIILTPVKVCKEFNKI